MPIRKVCGMCGTPFKVKPSRARRKYCSPRCGFDARMRRSEEKHIGKKYGHMTVLCRSDDTGDKKRKFTCRCDCGTVKDVRIDHLVDGDTLSCGCHRIEVGKRMVVENECAVSRPIPIGSKFGRWTVTGEQEPQGKEKIIPCRCDCGAEKTVFRQSLTTGESKSCGCYHKEVSAETAREKFTTHGLSGTSAYHIWQNNMRREADSEWTLEMTDFIFQVQPRCVACGSDEDLSIDHVYPVSKGGKLIPGNAVVLCRSCNSKKHDKEVWELSPGTAYAITRGALEFEHAWLNSPL